MSDEDPSPQRRQRSQATGGTRSNRSRNGASNNARKPRELIRSAREHFEDITGREVESVSAMNRTADGWRLNVEVVELARIPDTTSVLATYAVELDDEGDFAGYERVRRYSRGQIDL